MPTKSQHFQARQLRHSPSGPVWMDWQERLPIFPLCGDEFGDGLCRMPRKSALQFKHIELNPPGRVAWLPFDIDRDDAFDAADDADLPAPNVVSVNPSNGHAHLAYALKSPVGTAGNSREKPRELLFDVERGMIRRLREDPANSGRFAKNFGHSRWRTIWLSPEPFELKLLLDHLDRADLRPYERLSELAGQSRAVELFDRIRGYAYRHVRDFKCGGGNHAAWLQRLTDVALAWNMDFVLPLSAQEVKSTARSVAKWTWRRFSMKRFSILQSNRARTGNLARGRKTAETLSELFEAAGRAGQGPVYPDMANVLLVSRGDK